MTKVFSLVVILLMLAVSFPVYAADNMKAFPPAEKGMIRYVLQLQKQNDETVFKVELIVGKTVSVDKRNNYFFGGRIEKEVIKGWGFTRYMVGELGPLAGTMMAVDPKMPKAERFVKLGGAPYLIRYNSRLPVVVYVPEGVEVRYRIWSAGDEIKMIEKN